MRRRTAALALGLVALVGGGLAWLTLPPRRPEPPPLFWIRVDNDWAGPGIHSSPRVSPISGFEDVRAGRSHGVPTGFFESRMTLRNRVLMHIDMAVGTDLYIRFGGQRPVFDGIAVGFLGDDSQEPPFHDGWEQYAYLSDALPPDAIPEPALTGDWSDESGEPDVWTLVADGMFFGGDGSDARTWEGRWGVRDGLVLLACEDWDGVGVVLHVEEDGTLMMAPHGETLRRRDP